MWAMGNDFKITDAEGEDVYLIDGKAFSWGDDLSFLDMEGKEHAQIKQKLMSFNPCYQIIRDGAVFAKVIKEFSWFKKKFSLDVPGPNDYSIEGSFWKHNYKFLRSGKIVATVSKESWTWNDSYGVEIVSGEDDISILCAAIVIDQVLHDEKS